MNISKVFENFIFRSIPVWVYLISIIFMAFLAISGIYLTYKINYVSDKHPKIAKAVKAPLTTLDILIKNTQNFILNGSLNPRVFKSPHPIGTYYDSATPINGYLLISAFDGEINQSLILLYNLQDQKIIKTWDLELDVMRKQFSHTYEMTDLDRPMNFRAQHPIITEDGGVIVSSGEGVLAKFDKNGKYNWHIERHFHHSIEAGIENGTYISQIITSDTVKLNNKKDIKNLRNDGYVIFNNEGTILE